MELSPLAMFAALFVLLVAGYPVAFTIGAVALAFGAIFLGVEFFDLLPLRIWGIMSNFSLLAVPLFIFMGVVLERTGLAEDLLETMGQVFGRIRGGLAVTVVAVGAILAASTGVVGATVVTMGVISLPTMLRHGYRPALASGVVAASGTLGQILPPSIILILLAEVMGVPVGRLFMAAVVPGVLLVVLFMVFVLALAWLKPALAPALRTDEARASGRSLLGPVLTSLLPVLILVVAVLGSIFFGIATPTESAAVGAIGAVLLGAAKRRLRWKAIDDAALQTVRLTSMVFLVVIGASAFGLVFMGMGGDALAHDFLTGLPGGAWGFLLFSMVLLFVLGFVLDFLEICFLVVPILVPVAAALGIDPLWFAALIALNLQTSFLTPPFGFSLFYLKAVAPSVDMVTIYRGALPFVGLQLFALAILLAFPGLVQWLPELMVESR
jgi:tripartite ATP-independent transporter DctM subunit